MVQIQAATSTAIQQLPGNLPDGGVSYVFLTQPKALGTSTDALRSNTQWQRHALRNKVRPMAQYINRLKKRMVSKGFQADDPLFAALLNAERATHALLVQTELLANPSNS